jgi:predicted DNA-binding transcriptional regulator YafY
MSKRTVYRDLAALETELDVPIWEEGKKRGVVDGYFLPPVTFTQAEAMNIFLAARLMQNYSYVHNPSVVATFMKLNTILPTHLRDQVKNTLDYLGKLPRDERKLNNFYKIAEAWLSRRRATIKYHDLDVREPVELTIDPYFIEPSILGLSSYIIAYCHLRKAIRAFKIDHIIGDVTITSDTYEIPATFNANEYLSSAWDIYTSEDLKTSGIVQEVKLRFSPKVGETVKETLWHPSQVTEIQADGSMIMTLKVRSTYSFRTWIMRWEKEVEVLAPRALRNEIGSIVRSLADVYRDVKAKRKVVSSKEQNKINLPPEQSSHITNEKWQRIAEFLPSRASTGRPRLNDLKIISGILYQRRNHIRWSDIPRAYGAPTTCYSRFKVYQRLGIWDQIEEILLAPK